MTDKDKIDDDKFMRVVKGEEPLKDRPHIKSRDNDDGIIATHGKDKTSKVAQMIKDLDKTIKEKSKDMDCEIFVTRDEWGKTRFVIREKVKDNEREFEEAVGTEISEITEAFSEARFEEGDNVIRNVCLLSKVSKNNRIYLDEALDNVVSLASGVKVFADHPKKGETVRSVKDVIGAIEHPHRSGGKIYGNLRILSSHKDWVFALAKETPNLVGMSILAKGKMHPERDSEGREQVESVTMLKSIDLVSEPATTSGMYEQTLALKKGKIQKVRVGKKFDKSALACEFSFKVTCPVYSELNVNYEKCLLYKDGENCPYSEGGEFYRGKKSEAISDGDFVNKVKEK